MSRPRAVLAAEPDRALPARRSRCRCCASCPASAPARELPDTELEVRDVETDREHLAAYDDVCGFARDDVLPPTYPHIVAFPLAMRIMAERAFPFPLLGLVHIGNEIDAAPADRRRTSRSTVRVRAQDLEPHDRGTQFDDGRRGARGRGARLELAQRLPAPRTASGSGGERGATERGASRPRRRGAHWRVPADIGRRYGAVSGDRNPIHLHGWSAKLFGMPRPIAHGMWLKARCLAELEADAAGRVHGRRALQAAAVPARAGRVRRARRRRASRSATRAAASRT